MIENRKKTFMYWLVICVLELVSLLLAIFCIIKFVSQDNYLTGFAFFSTGLCLLSGTCMVFHIKKLFNWYYKKSGLATLHSRPEFFETSPSICLAPKEKAYKTLKLTTLILQGINIVLQIVLLLI